MKHALKKMQYRFAVIYETPGRILVVLLNKVRYIYPCCSLELCNTKIDVSYPTVDGQPLHLAKVNLARKHQLHCAPVISDYSVYAAFPKMYRKSVLHLYRFAAYISRCSKDLR